MALSDKNILITPSTGSALEPRIVFSGASSTVGPQNITLQVYPTNNGTLSFEGSAGQLLSISNSMSGTIFSVNDVSGIPSIEVLDTGEIRLAQYNGFVDVLNSTNATSTATGALQVVGGVGIGRDLWVGGTIYRNGVSIGTGAQGVQGAPGAQGVQGTTGSPGAQGVQGTTGSPGAQGVQGTTGSPGAQGVQGTTGSPGAQGVQGAQGRQGAQGVQGTTGSPGAQGVQGTTGSPGAQGVQGTTGGPGAQGVQGGPGAPGAQGTSGGPGAQGVQGATGSPGAQGVQGGPGAPGAQGVQGAQGRQGAQGVQGTGGGPGAQGVQGAPGAQGPQGVQGTGGGPGAQGVQGAPGAQGVLGAQGPQGRQGATGSPGAQGVQGGPGAQGVQGAPGAQGTTGGPGAQGVQGAQGRQGAQGSTGGPGAQGVQGAPGGVNSGSYGQLAFYNATPSTTVSPTTNLSWTGNQNLYVTGSINATINITAYASDRRLKTNVNQILNAVTKVKKLSGFTYNWNALANQLAGYDVNESQVGVFAQDVQEVQPEAVKSAPFDSDYENNTSKSGENYLTVQYDKLAPLLIEAIKELNLRIEHIEQILDIKK